MSEPPNFDLMTRAEVRAWFDAERARATAAFADVAVPRISRAKRDDAPAWESAGWAFKLSPGVPVSLGPAPRGRAGAERVLATMHGLRACEDGELVVVVETGDRLVALRRADGGPWGENPDAPWVTVPELDVECHVWGVDSDDQPVACSGPVTTMTARTTCLEDLDVR